jgi:hypothetical protein
VQVIVLQHRVGRLLETRFATPIENRELDEFDRVRARLRAELGDERVVVMDFRRAAILAPEVADTLVGLLHGPNPHLLRNGVLVPTASAVVAMQLARIVREADNERRRVFRDRHELEEWLGELLDPSERLRLKEFLEEEALTPR